MVYSSVTKYCLIGQESTQGTPVTADKDIGLVQDITEELTRVVDNIYTISAIDSQGLNSGTRENTINLSVVYQHGRIFEYILGGVGHAQSTNDWTHTFSISNSLPSLTLEAGCNDSTDTVYTHAGCIVNSVELVAELNKPLMFNAEIKGMTSATSSSASSAVISTLATFDHSLCSVSINGSSASEVQNFKFNFSSKAEYAHGLSSEDPQTLKANQLEITFSGTIGFDDQTYQTLFLNNTAHAIAFSADNGTSLGSGERSLDLALQACKWRKKSIAASVGELIFLEVEGTGLFNTMTGVDNISSSNW